MSYCTTSPFTSEVIPGGPGAAVAFAGSALSLILLKVLPAKLAPIAAGWIGTVSFDLSNFCTNDPPAMPSTSDLTLALAELFGDPVSRQRGILTFLDFVGASVWPTYCQCVAGPQPTPPAPPTPPTDLPTIPDITPAPVGGTPCLIIDLAGVHDTGTSVVPWTYPPPGTSPQMGSIPASATSVQWQLIVQDNLGSGAKLEAALKFYQSNQTTLISSQSVNCWTPSGSGAVNLYADGVSNNGTQFGSFPTLNNGLLDGQPFLTASVPSGAAYVHVDLANVGTADASLVYLINMAVYCGGTTSDSNGCCPEDPAVLAAILQVQAQLTSLIASMPTGAVNSYAAGAAHTGLTGNGALSFTDDAIGVKVNLTTAPPNVGVVIGDPNYYTNAGWLNLITEQGPLSGIRIEYDGQFIPFPVLVASLAYSLTAGVVATITEVTAGP